MHVNTHLRHSKHDVMFQCLLLYVFVFVLAIYVDTELQWSGV